MANEWRPVIAALANPDARSVYAEVVLGLPDAAGLSPKKRERADEGLVVRTPSGTNYSRG